GFGTVLEGFGVRSGDSRCRMGLLVCAQRLVLLGDCLETEDSDRDDDSPGDGKECSAGHGNSFCKGNELFTSTLAQATKELQFTGLSYANSVQPIIISSQV